MSGNLIFKNVIIGGYHPDGAECDVTIKDAGKFSPTTHHLRFGESWAYTPQTDDITVTIKPTKAPGMKSWEGANRNKGDKPHDVGRGPPKYDIKYYIIEDPYSYKVSVFSNKNSVPAPANKYV